MFSAGEELMKSKAVNIIQMNENEIKTLVFSDESKTKQYSGKIFFKEGSLGSVSCNCFNSESKLS